MKKVLDYDPLTGMKQEYHSNPDGTFTIKTSQDVSGLLNNNAEDRSAAGKGFSREMYKMASIPLNLWHQWWSELGSDPGARQNQKWLKAKLNSNEFIKLRTKEGRM